MVITGADGSFYGLEVDQWSQIYRQLVARVARENDDILRDLVGDTPPPLVGIRGLSTPEAGLRALQEESLDIAFCGYYLTPERVSIADPTPPLLSSGYTMVTNAKVTPPTDMQLMANTFPKFPPNAMFAFLLLILLSFVYAHGIWLLESSKNSKISVTYGWGIFDGFYMAMTAASTSGYGDLVPQSFFGKILTGTWILTGFYCMCMIAASLTTGIVADKLDSPLVPTVTKPEDMIGLRVGTYFSAAQRTIDIIEPRVGRLIQYSSVQWAYSSLARGDIDVILDDFMNAKYFASKQPYGGKFVLGGDPFMPTDYGFYFIRPNATTHSLYPHLYRAVLDYSRGELTEVRKLHMGKWVTYDSQFSLSAEKNRIIERTLHAANNKMIAVLISVLFVAVVTTFFSMREERAKDKENKMLLNALGVGGSHGGVVDIYSVRLGATALFEQFDVNHDGHLELSEITDALESIGFNKVGLAEKLKKEAFLTGTPMDKEDGYWLSLSDFQSMMQRIALEGFASNDNHGGGFRGAPAELQHIFLILADLRESSQQIENRMDQVQSALQDLNDIGVMSRVREAVRALKGIETRPLAKYFGLREPQRQPPSAGEGGVSVGGVTVDAAIESINSQAQRTQAAQPNLRSRNNNSAAGAGGGYGGKPGQLHTHALEELLMMRSATLGKAELEVGRWEGGAEAQQAGASQNRVSSVARQMEKEGIHSGKKRNSCS